MRQCSTNRYEATLNEALSVGARRVASARSSVETRFPWWRHGSVWAPEIGQSNRLLPKMP